MGAAPVCLAPTEEIVRDSLVPVRAAHVGGPTGWGGGWRPVVDGDAAGRGQKLKLNFAILD